MLFCLYNIDTKSGKSLTIKKTSYFTKEYLMTLSSFFLGVSDMFINSCFALFGLLLVFSIYLLLNTTTIRSYMEKTASPYVFTAINIVLVVALMVYSIVSMYNKDNNSWQFNIFPVLYNIIFWFLLFVCRSKRNIESSGEF